MKIAVSEIAPITAVWFRITLGMIVAAPITAIRREFRFPSSREMLPLLFLGLIGVVFHQNIQFIGMRTAGVANANWLIAGTPSIVALLGWIFLKEKLSAAAMAGLLISGAGVLVVAGLGTRGLGMFRADGWGDMLIFVSAVNWAVFQVVSRKLLGSKSPAFTAFWINFFAAAAQSGLLLIFRPDITQLKSVSPNTWAAVFFLGCVCSGLCYTLWYDGLSVMPAVRVVAFQFLQPILGVTAAYFLAGERFTSFLFVGGAMIISGIWMINRRGGEGPCPK
jgi:drug/metabolite transporter (DMT)-like permease